MKLNESLFPIAMAEELPLNECQEKFNTITGNKLQIKKSQICVHSPKTKSDTCQGKIRISFVIDSYNYLSIAD